MSGTTLMNLSYNYQAAAGQMGPGTTAGNANQLMTVSGTINGTAESANYAYDLWGRVVTSSQTTNNVSAQRRFVYDRWGNRTAVWDAVTGGNQIQNVSLQQSGGAPTNQVASVTAGVTVNYVYDSAGNVTGDGTHTYSYDAESRSSWVDGGGSIRYHYDYANRRVKKTVGSEVTHYVWEGPQVIAEYNATTGALAAEYVNLGGSGTAKVENGVTRYLLKDRLSTRLILDSNGSVVGRQGHLPFGEEVGNSGQSEKHSFTSYERDGESGSDYAVNRQLTSSLGRFTRPDPYKGSSTSGTAAGGVRPDYIDI
jgi:hypothetical protein